jgi:class 3 adenylate cyclase
MVGGRKESTPNRIKSFLTGSPEAPQSQQDQKPIADLFRNTTVLFADIAGFTAWSSQREPTEVFTLLQTLYQAFDKIARKFGVFKIETIGDCYVAVTGLPDPQDDHAVRMARFSRECVHRMHNLVKNLAVSLGPDTEDLCLRVGMHSGPVTAGVLRGEKSRFQLFGDTVNTAARMESTGEKNKIQCSNATAELLRSGRREKWLIDREDVVVAKGKGEMRTCWILTRAESSFSELDSSMHINSQPNSSRTLAQNKHYAGSTISIVSEETYETDSSSSPTGEDSLVPLNDLAKANGARTRRLIDWNVDLLGRLLKAIIAHRNITAAAKKSSTELPKWEGSGRLAKDEVVDIISFPKLEPPSMEIDPDSVELKPEVLSQLRNFISTIAAMYRNNPFHNYEHASHVTMTANKLFNRIVIPATSEADNHESMEALAYASKVKCNPLAHFAVVLAAVIHDVDHPGVSNMDLIQKKAEIAALYDNKSVAEQNSVDVAWELLMDPGYGDLQQCIYQDTDEFAFFRQLVVNLVMATDIFDKEAKASREKRWKQAFGTTESNLSEDDLQNLRATVMLEHTIQAADVGYTMQHWQVYQKWNGRLFGEMVSAFEAERSNNDPTGGWFEGELMFFDFYITPLARKMIESGAYGEAAEEYLAYAVDNRSIWEAKGNEIICEMAGKYHRDKVVSTQNPAKRDADPNTSQSRAA